MARTTTPPDAGQYNYPALIQKPADYVDDGSGGNAAGGKWVTVRGGGANPLMVDLESGKFGRGLKRAFRWGQQFPEANHWAEMRYSSMPIDASMRLVVRGRNYQILGAIDPEFRHVVIVLALVEEQAQGST